MRAKEFTFEAVLGTTPKRPSRGGSRPERGHEPQPRYVTDRKTGKQYDPEEEFDKLKNSEDFKAQMKRMAQKEDIEEQFCEDCGGTIYGSIDEAKASRSLCTSSKPDADLGASMLSSCKSQGLRSRDGNKSHKLGKSAKSRVKVGGHKIKGNKYGGPLPDWS
jgi:hypothetical protein